MTKPTFSPRPQRLALAVHAAMLALPMMATGAAIFTAPSAAHAQAPAQAMHDFDIPAGPLSTALTRAAAQSGVPLTADAALTAGKTAPALKGRMTLREALAQLLAGSGLIAGTEGASIVIKAAAPAPGSAKEAVLPVVTVRAGADTDGSTANGYRVKSASVGALGEKSLKDTPYSIEVYSRELMDNKQARTLSEVVKGDAAVGLTTNTTVNEDNVLAIRGIGIDGDTGQKLDGLNFLSRASDLPLEHVESVEILKGAGAFLYGFAQPGGIINYRLKRPTDEPVRSLSTQITDSGSWLLHGDIGGRLGTDSAFGYRINLVGEAGDTYINDGSAHRGSGSVALDWRITPDVVWRVDALKARNTRKGAYWALYPTTDGAVDNWTLGPAPAPIDGGKRLAPSWSRNHSEHETYGTDISWHVAPQWGMTLAHRNSESGREFMQPVLFASASGDYSGRVWSYSTRFKSEQTQGQISGKFETGLIGHDVTLGVSHTKTRSLVTPDADTLSDSFGPGNLSNPGEFTNPVTVVGLNTATEEYSRVTRRELFASDTLHLGKDWDVIIGLRRGSLDNAYSDYKRSATTPTLAAIYRAAPWASVYASYVESLEEGAIAPETAANAGQIFEPLVSKQREVSIKLDGNGWTANAALFQLQRGLTYTDAANVFTQDGEARYEGLELSGKVRLSKQWLVTASAMWLDATNRKTTDAALEGKTIAGVAQKQARVYAEYSMPGLPLTLTSGVQYLGKRSVDEGNQWNVGSVTLLDLGARYVTRVNGRQVTVRLNVDNATNRAYWLTHTGWNALVQGAPRTVKLGAQIEF